MKQDIFLVDTHCHLDLLSLSDEKNDIETLIKNAQEIGVKHILNVCVSLGQFQAVLAIAQRFPFITASVGVHPNEQAESVDVEELVKLANHSKVIAIGETGLDYYRSEGDLDWQRARFCTHIQAALQTKKPLIVHTRAAKEDTITLLRAENARDVGGIMHCFTEDWDTAKAALDQNFYISFSGIITFKNAVEIQAVAKKVPLDRLLIETDAPYLAPNPYRGKTNEPAYVYHTAAFIAEMRGISLEEFAHQTSTNFFNLFPGAGHV